MSNERRGAENHLRMTRFPEAEMILKAEQEARRPWEPRNHASRNQKPEVKEVFGALAVGGAAMELAKSEIRG